MRILLPLCITALGLFACDLRRPDEGYDPDWKPDHEAAAQGHADIDSAAGTDRSGETDHDLSAESSERPRPSEIIADTGLMTKTFGTWEMVGVEKSDYTAYWDRKGIVVILEEMPEVRRTYYFDRGALYYYNEKSADGSTQMTAEFDDIGDIIGARKTVDGRRANADIEDYGSIVEHAVELKIAAEE